MVCAFDLLIQSLIIRGLRPRIQRLDNEASLALINYLTKQAIDYQLAPQHIHRHNNAERAIQTFKNHFFASVHNIPHTTGPSRLMANVSSMIRSQMHPLQQTPRKSPAPK
jgi:hypothetical protein